jgi:hypothetical protein
VALTTQVYRRAVDAAWAAIEAERAAAAAALPPPPPPPPRAALEAAAWQELAQVFARGQDGAHRGLTPGFLEGPRHQSLVRGRAPRHRGVFLGEVLRVDGGGGGGGGGGGAARVRLAAPLRRGDGVVFDRGDPQAEEQGGAVHDIRAVDGAKGGGGGGEGAAGDLVDVVFGRGQVAWGQVAAGQLLWKNKDPALEARLRATYDGVAAAARRRLPVAVAVAAAAGAPLRVTLTDGEGRAASADTECRVEVAAARALTAEAIEKAVGRHLGDQASFAAASFDLSACDLGAGLFVSGAAIKDARRRAAAALLQAQRRPAPPPPAAPADEIVAGLMAAVRRGAAAAGPPPPPVLRVLCRTRAQVDAALAVPWLTELVLDFLEVHGLREACAAVQAAGRRAVVATPRILKPDERRLWAFYVRLGADALLVRGAGLLQELLELGGPGAAVPGVEGRRVPALEGDFSLNAANALSADLFLRRGLARLAPTHDCDAAQLRDLARALGEPPPPAAGRPTRPGWFHRPSPARFASSACSFCCTSLCFHRNRAQRAHRRGATPPPPPPRTHPLTHTRPARAPQARAPPAWKPSSTPTCRSSTPSTAPSRASSPRATPTSTAATPASPKPCTCAAPTGATTWCSRTRAAGTPCSTRAPRARCPSWVTWRAPGLAASGWS